jgi:serine/threonine protein kinase
LCDRNPIIHQHRNAQDDEWVTVKAINRYLLAVITEVFCSGTLRQYRKKVKVMNESILRRWAWQILQGLLYLHGHDPPIVHRSADWAWFDHGQHMVWLANEV